MATITQESFDALLEWLDPDDRETAGQKYEIIYTGLVRIFVSKGFSDAEHLADKTIDVVILRLPEIRDTYEGEKVKYFHGVARFIILEERRRKEIATDVVPERLFDVTPTTEECEFLVRCLRFLPADKRELILDYHLYAGEAKVEHHRRMASDLKITENALRGRAHHIRDNLRKCVVNALKTS